MMWRGEPDLFDAPAGPPPRLRPPAPAAAASDLGAFRLIGVLRSNTLAAWPVRAYREVLLHQTYLGTDCYLVNDPELAHQVLTAPGGHYERPLGFRRLLAPALGRGLLLAEGAEWRAQRKALAPAFACRAVERLIPLFREVAERLVRRLSSQSRANLAEAFQETAIDALGVAAFSMPFDRYAGPISRIRRQYFARAARVSILDFLARREGDFLLNATLRGRLGRQLDAVIEEIIEARARLSAECGDRPDLIGLMRNAAPTARELRDQIATMIATGFDSTGQLLFWTAYLLSGDQCEQTAIRDEIRAFPADAVTGLDDLKKWPRLGRALMEALRLYPPIATITRTACREVALGGVTARPGSLVTIAPWVMHRHQLLWERPDCFIPERFEGSSHCHARPGYIPFGVGQRTCIGGTFAIAEASLALARLLESFEIRLDDSRPVLPTCIVTTAPSIEPWFALRRAQGSA